MSMKETNLNEMKDHAAVCSHRYGKKAVFVERMKYDLPPQRCRIPEYEEFPICVTFVDGTKRMFSDATSHLTEIDYEEYQYRFLHPYLEGSYERGKKYGEKLTKDEATRYFYRAVKVFVPFEEEGESYDLLVYLSYRSDAIGRISTMFLAWGEVLRTLVSEGGDREKLQTIQRELEALPPFGAAEIEGGKEEEKDVLFMKEKILSTIDVLLKGGAKAFSAEDMLQTWRTFLKNFSIERSS